MRIRTERMSVAIDEENASVLSITSEDGTEIIRTRTGVPVFELTALDDKGERRILRPRGGRLADEDTLCYDRLYDGENAADIRVKLIFSREDAEAIALLVRVENADAHYTPVECLALQLEGLQLGERARDETVLYPHHAGERIEDPARALRSERYQSFWRAQSRLDKGRYVRENNYCGLMSMTWMYLQGGGYGLYMGSHDARFPVTGMRMLTGGADWLGFGYRIYYRITPGARYTSGKFVLSLSERDWHAGARRYRAYIDPHLFPPEDPPFLRQEAALHQCYQFKRADGIYHRFEDIPALFDEGIEHGIRHMFIASWNRSGFDSNYPEYYPDMELGTAMDLRRGLEYVKAHGGFTTLYVNARLFDRKSDYYRTYGEQMEIRDERNEPLTESYEPNTFSLCCPADDRWQHDLTDICDFAARAYGAKGIYLDQLASAEPFPCYHAGHSHTNIGEFNRGYLKILSDLRARLKARDPDAYLMTENCGDIYSAYTWGNLTWNGTDYDEYYNLFRYTFPQYVQVNMVNPRSWEPDPARRSTLFYLDIERCVLMGNILWIGLSSRFDDPALAQARAYVLKAAALRARLAQTIAHGTYLDDAYVHTLYGARASCFDTGEGQALLLIGNAEENPRAQAVFELPFQPSVVTVDDVDEAGNSASIRAQGCRLTVEPGKTRLTAVFVRA